MSDTPKVGRPKLPKSDKRSLFVSTRLSPEEYKEIETAIKLSDMDKTEWIRTKLLAAARRA